MDKTKTEIDEQARIDEFINYCKFAFSELNETYDVIEIIKFVNSRIEKINELSKIETMHERYVKIREADLYSQYKQSELNNINLVDFIKKLEITTKSNSINIYDAKIKKVELKKSILLNIFNLSENYHNISEEYEAKIILVESVNDWLANINEIGLLFVIEDATNLNSIIRIANRIKPIYDAITESEIVKRELQLKENEEKSLTDQKELLINQFEKCNAAIDVFNNFKNIKEGSDEFIKSNIRFINKIFNRIHRPKEFSVDHLDIEGSQLVLNRADGSFVKVHQMSSGQRTSLAISLLLALHMSAKKAPKLIIFDDPIANFDDMHFMNFVDILREMAFSGIQLIITTADTKIASYYRRKFSFFGDRYLHYSFNRFNAGKTKVNCESYEPDSAAPIVVGEKEMR